MWDSAFILAIFCAVASDGAPCFQVLWLASRAPPAFLPCIRHWVSTFAAGERRGWGLHFDGAGRMSLRCGGVSQEGR